MFIEENLTKDNVTLSVPEILIPEELEQISALYSKWLINDPCSHCACFGGVQYARDAAWLRNNFSVKGAKTVLAKEEGRIIGFAQFFVESQSFPDFAGDLAADFSYLDRAAYIYLILVKHEYQHRGLGKRIYAEVFKECISNGCKFLLAEVFVCPVPNSSSLKFHESLGFEYTGQSVSHERKRGDRSINLTYTRLCKRLC